MAEVFLARMPQAPRMGTSARAAPEGAGPSGAWACAGSQGHPLLRFFILDFAEWASFAEVVPVEESPPTGRSLAALIAGGGGSLVAGASDEPMMLAYAFRRPGHSARRRSDTERPR